MSNQSEHRAHPVRNFFYVLYSLFNLAAFLCFFYALYAITLPMRVIFLIVTGAVLVFAFCFCVVRPILSSRPKRRR